MEEKFVIPDIYGGLGNRLFQYAAAAGVAELWGRAVCFSSDAFEDNDHDNPLTICDMFPNIRRVNGVLMVHTIEYSNDDVYIYKPFPATPPTEDHIQLTGLFQSPRYSPKGGVWPHWENALGAEGLRAIEQRSGLDAEPERQRTWFIHFRFGDFLKSAYYYWDLSKYYMKCLAAIPAGAHVHAFSDEPDRVREWLTGVCAELGLELTWSDAKRDVEALYEMSLCWGGAVTANSTFSWWGAYFAHMKAGAAHRAYYPDGWGLGLPRPTDLVPSWGEKVATEWSPHEN